MGSDDHDRMMAAAREAGRQAGPSPWAYHYARDVPALVAELEEARAAARELRDHLAGSALLREGRG